MKKKKNSEKRIEKFTFLIKRNEVPVIKGNEKVDRKVIRLNVNANSGSRKKNGNITHCRESKRLATSIYGDGRKKSRKYLSFEVSKEMREDKWKLNHFKCSESKTAPRQKLDPIPLNMKKKSRKSKYCLWI